MPNLSTMSLQAVSQSVIIYGAPKTGKTELAVKALATKYKILYVDLEGGVTTLLKLPDELKQNVEVISVFDTKDEPNAISTCLKLAEGKPVKVCEVHGKTNCAPCLSAKKPTTTWELNKLDPTEWVVIFDSFTQLTSSAQGHVCRGLDLEKQKMTFDHFRAQGVLLERFLDYVQAARYNVVVITHEMGLEQSDGIEKLQPSGGTKNFARNVPKYFDHIIYTAVKNRKHTASSSTTDATKVMAGSRTDVVVDMNDLSTVLSLFGESAAPSTQVAPITGSAPSESKAAGSPSGQSLQQRMAARRK